MSLRNDQDRLLSDVLSNSDTPDFRSSLLETTIRRARRERRFRRGRQRVVALMVIVALSALGWQLSPWHKPDTRLSPCLIVHTQRLPEAQMVRTSLLTTLVSTASFEGVRIVHTQPGSKLYRSITGDELLAMVSPTPAALIGIGPRSQSLIFSDPESQKRYFTVPN